MSKTMSRKVFHNARRRAVAAGGMAP